jgi:hypothetical protein
MTDEAKHRHIVQHPPGYLKRLRLKEQTDAARRRERRTVSDDLQNIHYSTTVKSLQLAEKAQSRTDKYAYFIH